MATKENHMNKNSLLKRTRKSLNASTVVQVKKAIQKHDGH
jgi:hypothetical protein